MAGLAAERPVPREGRPTAGDPRCALRLARRPGSTPRSRRTTSPRSASSWTSTSGRRHGFFTDYVTVGNFDIAQFSWSGDAFPLASLTQIYRTGAESNFGKISSPEIDAKIEQTVGELDPGEGAHARQRARQDAVRGGFQPSADAVDRKHRGAKQFGELRRVRPGRRGLHQDRLHEAVTRARCGEPPQAPPIPRLPPPRYPRSTPGPPTRPASSPGRLRVRAGLESCRRRRP